MGKSDIRLPDYLCGFPWLIKAVNLVLKCIAIFCQSFFNNYILAEGGRTHACVEPIFWVVDSVLISLGPFLTVLVVFMSSFNVFIAYWILYPFYKNQNKWLAYGLALIGNWILMNFVFNYYMGYSVSPGHPPKHGIHVDTDVCKKCLTPKPPRTHHCSICNQCILKMDHHCPWMNHCVGHWNHRYFYLFMVYTLLGCIFLLTIGSRTAYLVMFTDASDFDFYYENVNDILAAVPLDNSNHYFFKSSGPVKELPLSYYLETQQFRYKSLMFLGFFLVVIFVSVLVLTLWHGKLISGGETSVEFLKNKFEKIKFRKEGKPFKNPYDFGWRTNWRLFLGLHSGRTFWRHVLLPSSHKPLDNGITWTKAEDIETVLNGKLMGCAHSY